MKCRGLTPKSDSGLDGVEIAFKKRKKKARHRGLLSFEKNDEDDESTVEHQSRKNDTQSSTPRYDASDLENDGVSVRSRVKTNPNTGRPAPKALTKASIAAEAAERERLRKEFLAMQEQVRGSQIAIPFVFYDGSNIPGGIVNVNKGDHIWLFLERCRKVGAEMGVGNGGGAADTATAIKGRAESRKSWARIGVDDLLLVRGEVIVPHVSLLLRKTLIIN